MTYLDPGSTQATITSVPGILESRENPTPTHLSGRFVERVKST